MKGITDEEETIIDNSKYYNSTFRKKPIFVNREDICFYGSVDFNNKEDVEMIKAKNLISSDGESIYSNFDYEKGITKTVDGRLKDYDTYDPVLWFKFCFCLIGKPEKIIVFKIDGRTTRRV